MASPRHMRAQREPALIGPQGASELSSEADTVVRNRNGDTLGTLGVPKETLCVAKEICVPWCFRVGVTTCSKLSGAGNTEYQTDFADIGMTNL